MQKDIIVLNNAETAIYNELRELRAKWTDVEAKIEQNPDNEIIFAPICDICERNYKTCRLFVARAFNVDIQTIEDIIHGKYKVIAEESIPVYNA